MLVRHRASTAKTAFEIMSFNLQASDEPLVCYSRRIRVAGARGIKSEKSLALLIDFSRVFGLIWPLSRMLKPVLYPRFCCRRHLAGTIAGYHLKGRAARRTPSPEMTPPETKTEA